LFTLFGAEKITYRISESVNPYYEKIGEMLTKQ